jgi:Spy/CpxP family protein refolding chaperone
MRTIAALGALAVILGLTLPAMAQSPATTEAVQAQAGPGGGPAMGGPGPGRGPGGPGMHGERGGWQRHAGRHHMRRGRSIIFMALRNQKELGLSPQQVSSLQQMGMDAARAGIKRRADVQLARLDLMSLMRAEPVDMAKVEAKIRDIEKLKADGAIGRIRTNEAAKAQLTPDQREKLKTLRMARWSRQGGGAGAGDGRSEAPSAFQERS